MTGNSCNKNKQSGQVLLIIIMLMTTALTVALSVSFKSQTETAVTKLEQDTQKALAAADAGIEKALSYMATGNTWPSGESKTYSDAAININWNGIDSDNSKVLVDDNLRNSITSPLIKAGTQYTFYLSDYNPSTGFSNPWTGNLDIYFKSESGCPSIEVTYVSTTNQLSREAYNSCIDGKIGNATDLSELASPYKTIEGTVFHYKANTKSVANQKIVIVRVLFADTYVGFDSSSNFRSQRKQIVSTVVSTTGVTKKVQLFQYKSQIPTDFFVTSF